MRAKKRDKSEAGIVQALRKCGYMVWLLDQPDDLLVWHPRFGQNWFRMISAKTLDAKGRLPKRRDQAEQDAFVAMTGTPRVGSPEHAIAAMEAA